MLCAGMVADWNKGLPLDVREVVAKAGGVKEMQMMRRVCKTWQQGLDLRITTIAITSMRHPPLFLGCCPAIS